MWGLFLKNILIPTKHCYGSEKCYDLPAYIQLFLAVFHRFLQKDYLNLTVGPRCPIMHQFSHKTHVDVKNDGMKLIIKAALSLSQRLVHNVMFEVVSIFDH